MKVVSDRHAEVVKHFRTIIIEDGPIVDCGEGPTASYMPGTLIRADKIQMEWVGDAEPVTVLVSGMFTGTSDHFKKRYDIRYRIQDSLPGWIQEILQ
jgi:hypothetical protein